MSKPIPEIPASQKPLDENGLEYWFPSVDEAIKALDPNDLASISKFINECKLVESVLRPFSQLEWIYDPMGCLRILGRDTGELRISICGDADGFQWRRINDSLWRGNKDLNEIILRRGLAFLKTHDDSGRINAKWLSSRLNLLKESMGSAKLIEHYGDFAYKIELDIDPLFPDSIGLSLTLLDRKWKEDQDTEAMFAGFSISS